jgi:hypothetical protein
LTVKERIILSDIVEEIRRDPDNREDQLQRLERLANFESGSYRAKANNILESAITTAGVEKAIDIARHGGFDPFTQNILIKALDLIQENMPLYREVVTLIAKNDPYPTKQRETPLVQDWDIVVESLFKIEGRSEKLKGNLPKVLMHGEAELVLSGLVPRVQDFLNHIMKFVPKEYLDDTESEIAKTSEGSNVIDVSNLWRHKEGKE